MGYDHLLLPNNNSLPRLDYLPVQLDQILGNREGNYLRDPNMQLRPRLRILGTSEQNREDMS